MKHFTLLFLLAFNMSLFATRYLVQTGAPGAAGWRAAGAGEELVNLTLNGKSLREWLGTVSLKEGDEIWLAAGTYTVSSEYNYPPNFKIYGGFGGTETSLAERVVNVNPWDFVNESIIDGDQQTNLFLAGGPRVAVFDGLTMKKGNSGNKPGALHARDGVSINACKFIDNVSTGNGGSVLLNGGGNISNSYFYHNKGNSGGAVHVGGGAGVTSSITNCLFESNQASGGAHNLGGALRSQFAGNLTVDKCIFKNNSAEKNGSAIHIQLNAATNYTTVSNSLIYGNTTKVAVYMAGGTLNNLTLVNNEAGGVYVANVSVPSKIYNSVCWGTGKSGEIASIKDNATAIVQNTACQSFQSANFIGTENINNLILSADNSGTESGTLYPEFINPASNNWEPGYNSALLNAGQTISSVGDDLTGMVRPQGASYDIGAYELPYFKTSVSFNEGGSVNTQSSDFVLFEPKGKSLVFSIIPESGYRIASLQYNGEDVKEQLIDGVYTAPALVDHATLAVNFSPITALNQINKIRRFFGGKNSIELRGLTAGETIVIYNLTGAKVFNATATKTDMSIPVADGIYVIKTAGSTQKLVVK